MAGGSKLEFEFLESYEPSDEHSIFVPLNILVNETDYDYSCGYCTILYIPESPRAHNVSIGHVCSILFQEKVVEQQDKDTILAVILRVLGNVIGIKH